MQSLPWSGPLRAGGALSQTGKTGRAAGGGDSGTGFGAMPTTSTRRWLVKQLGMEPGFQRRGAGEIELWEWCLKS